MEGLGAFIAIIFFSAFVQELWNNRPISKEEKEYRRWINTIEDDSKNRP